VLTGILLVAGFGLAALVSPDPRGFGTHQRFGLPPCSFQLLFDIPCPSCGMTTSFAHFVRGAWIDSARANPAGPMMAVVCVLLIPWCWVSAVLGRWWLWHRPGPAFLGVVISVFAVAFVQWVVRLVT
jgi:hypothetical protein